MRSSEQRVFTMDVASCMVGTALVLLAVDLFYVLFLGGIRIELAGTVIRSTTVEFPLIAIMVSGGALLIIRGKWREAALFGASFVLAGVIGEIALRVVDHPLGKPYVDYAAWYRPSEVFGHELVPGFEGRGPLDKLVKVNSHGVRDREFSLEKPEGTLRILGLGDSFTFGWGVSEDETFLKRLERLLADGSAPSVEAINAGVPGWGINQYYLFMRNRAREVRPDVIVVAYFLDDLSGPIREHISENRSFEAGLRYKGGFLHHSRLYNFSKSLADAVRQRNRAKRIPYLHDMSVRRAEWAKRDQHLIKRVGSDQERRQIAILDDFLFRSQGLVAELGSLLVVMYIPEVTQLHHPELQYINGVLGRLCRERGIPFIDMTPVFEGVSHPGEVYLWPEDSHTNATGHRLMAEALYETLCSLEAFEAPGCKGHLPRAALTR